MVWVLALIGVLVGILNVTSAEAESFLLAAIAFAVSASALSGISLVGGIVTNILGYVGAFVSGAAIVIALRVLFTTTRT